MAPAVQARGRLVAMLITALLAAGWTLSPAAAGAVERPRLLLVHAGGFVFGSPELMDRAARQARRHGFRPIAVEYELGDVSSAVADTVTAARRAGRRGPVYAYGESAGGTLVARLAQRGLVRSAVANSPIVDLPSWPPSRTLVDYGMATEAELVRESPNRHSSPRPILAIAPRSDTAVSSSATAAWARDDELVDLRQPRGEHIVGNGYGRMLNTALTRLERAAAAAAG